VDIPVSFVANGRTTPFSDACAGPKYLGQLLPVQDSTGSVPKVLSRSNGTRTRVEAGEARFLFFGTTWIATSFGGLGWPILKQPTMKMSLYGGVLQPAMIIPVGISVKFLTIAANGLSWIYFPFCVTRTFLSAGSPESGI